MGALASAAGAILAKLLEALLGALRVRRQDTDRVETHEQAAVAEAADETADVISEMAADRAAAASSAGVDGIDASSLAASLRARKASAGGGNPNS